MFYFCSLLSQASVADGTMGGSTVALAMAISQLGSDRHTMSAMAYSDHVPRHLLRLYEVHEYRHAAAILAHEFADEFEEICSALCEFQFTDAQIIKGGGNESEIPKTFSKLLRPKGWKESKLKARLMVDDAAVSTDTHKVDYVKNRTAFDLEWNSKDQTFDRDLYAFRAFFEYNRISAGVLVTRGVSMVPYFRSLGSGVLKKYGAEGGSTTHMGKLLPRLEAGRSGGCPVLAFGITPNCRKGN
jgi:CRISPR-associated protein Csd2